MSHPESFYQRVGGHETFDQLVRGFYQGVMSDPILAPMYPEDDIEGAIWRLTAFLEQYWGGPHDYQDVRGHPRLRMRHQPFPINPAARQRWLTHMRHALDQLNLAPLDVAELWDYLERAATSMVNTFAE
jgi:hemoglobin